MFTAGLETESLGRSGTGTAWPVSSSPLRNPLAPKVEEATLMILASSGEDKNTSIIKLMLFKVL